MIAQEARLSARGGRGRRSTSTVGVPVRQQFRHLPGACAARFRSAAEVIDAAQRLRRPTQATVGHRRSSSVSSRACCQTVPSRLGFRRVLDDLELSACWNQPMRNETLRANGTSSSPFKRPSTAPTLTTSRSRHPSLIRPSGSRRRRTRGIGNQLRPPSRSVLPPSSWQRMVPREMNARFDR